MRRVCGRRVAGLASLAGLMVVVFLPFTPALGQPQPAPAYPPINLGAARFVTALGGLDGPGLGLAANDQVGFVAVACERGTIQYWPRAELLGVRTGDGTPNALSIPGATVVALAWGSGPYLASAWTNQSVVLWTMPDGAAAHTIPAGTLIRALAVSPDGKVVAGGGDDGRVRLWAADTGKEVLKSAGSADWVLSLAFSPDGKTLASGGADGMVRLWDTSSGAKRTEFLALLPPQPNTPPPLNNTVTALAFSPDGKTLAVGGSDGFILLTNPADGKLIRPMQLGGQNHTAGITCLTFHPTGTLLLSGSNDRTVRAWAPENGNLQRVFEGHGSWVTGISFLDRGTRIASASADQTVRIWDISQPR